MLFESDFFGLITLFAMVNGITVGVVLIFQQRSHKLLGSLILSGVISLLSNLYTTTNLYLLFPWLYNIFFPFLFLTSSLILLYVESLTEKGFKLSKKKLIYFTGVFISIALFVPTLIKPETEKITILNSIYNNHRLPLYDWIQWGICLLHTWIILIISYGKIRNYREELKNNYSNVRRIDLKIVTKQMLFLSLMWLGITVVSIFSFNKILVDISINSAAVITALILSIQGYLSLFNIIRTVPQEIIGDKKEVAVDKKILIRFETLNKKILDNKFYLIPELTLSTLAEQTDNLRNDLSNIINRGSGLSFFDYINRLRVEHFKELISNPDNSLTILGVAMDSGFNSKAAFYNAFKKNTGLTPTQFLRTLK